MIECSICKSPLSIKKLHCEYCNTTYISDFQLPRLARLSKEHQILLEEFVLSNGKLKDLAVKLNTTYPTLKKKFNFLVQELTLLKEEDEKKIENILEKIEKKELTAQEGLKMIKELNGEL